MSQASRILCAISVFLLVMASQSYAQTGRNVAVVINGSRAASIRIGEYYAKKRALRPENIIRIKAAAADEISRADFSTTIETPIANALARHSLQDRILY